MLYKGILNRLTNENRHFTQVAMDFYKWHEGETSILQIRVQKLDS